MAAGLGFKTFTTGEVLTAADTNGYLMQGVLVFASSAARAAAITSPQEGQYSYLKDTNSTEYYDGAAWIAAPIGDITGVTAGKGLTGGGSSGDVTVSLGTTAKGDLVAGSGTTTAAVLPVGTNGQTLVADSSTATGLKWSTVSTSPTFVGATAYANGQTVSFTAGTRAVIPYNNESFDTNNFHSTSSNTGRMTIPTGYAGKYLIAAWAEAASNYAVRAYVYGTFAKNGSSISGTARGNSFSNCSDGFFNPTLTTIVDLAVGDYVDFGIALGATYTETGGIYGAFSIQWLGA